MAKPKVYGHSVSSICRWLGANGYKVADGESLFKALEMDVKTSSISAGISDGRREDQKYGKPAELSEEEAGNLIKLIGQIPGATLGVEAAEVAEEEVRPKVKKVRKVKRTPKPKPESDSSKEEPKKDVPEGSEADVKAVGPDDELGI